MKSPPRWMCVGRGSADRSRTTIVVTNLGSAARSFSSADLLVAIGGIASDHQLDKRPPLRARPLLPRQVEGHPNVGRLRLREGERQGLLPLPLAVVEVGVPRGQCAVKLIDLALDLPPSGQFLRRGDFELGLIDIVEEGEEPVILALGERVILVVVALGAADRQAEEDRARGVDPVDDRVDPELLDVDAPFLVDLRVAVKTGGDPLGERGIRAAGRRRSDRS